MTKAEISEILRQEGPKIRNLVEGRPAWGNSKQFAAQFAPFTRRQIDQLLAGNDCRVSTINNLAEKMGMNLGQILDLGDWVFDPQGLSERLKILRKKKGWNMDQCARMCGLSQPYISKLEAGCLGYRLSMIEKLARGLVVSLQDLLAKPK
jgi:DNA-binding Xre family transcriptional regulator